VPLIIAGPGVPGARKVADTRRAHRHRANDDGDARVAPFDADGIDIRPVINGATLPNRELYAESFAPLLDFGWSPLHSLRSDRWKYIDAPRPELFDIWPRSKRRTRSQRSRGQAGRRIS
jgi:hypothetical protein